MAYDPNTPVGSPPPGLTNPVWNPIYGTWTSGQANDPWAGNKDAEAQFEAARQYNMSHNAAGVYTGFGSPSYTAGITGSVTPATGPNSVPQNANAGTTTPATLGALASGRNGASVSTPGTFLGGSTTNPAAPSTSSGPNIAASSFINPAAQYMQDWGLKDLQSTYAGVGGLLSGPAMRGISDYAQKSALNNAWQPAIADYLANNQQQYNIASNDQQIPFNQAMQMAQLGLSGQQGSSQLAATLAALISGNTTAIGQAQAGGAVGGSNAINTALSQWLTQMMSQNTLNRVLPQGG